MHLRQQVLVAGVEHVRLHTANLSRWHSSCLIDRHVISSSDADIAPTLAPPEKDKCKLACDRNNNGATVNSQEANENSCGNKCAFKRQTGMRTRCTQTHLSCHLCAHNSMQWRSWCAMVRSLSLRAHNDSVILRKFCSFRKICAGGTCVK